MEKVIAVLCLTALSVLAQEELTVQFKDTEPKLFKQGDSHTFECVVNRPLAYLFENNIRIIRRKSNGDEVVLFTRVQRAAEAKPEFYDLTREEVGDSNHFKFEIKKMRDLDEGELVCKVEPGSNNQMDKMTESVVKIDIYRNMEMLSLKFDQMQEISQSLDSAYEVDAGTYPTTCMAMGSNPAVSNLKLYFNDKLIEGNMTTMKMESEEHRFTSKLTAAVKITVEDSNQKLECVAMQPHQDGEMVSVSVPIKVFKYDPEITCHEGQAYPGMMYPKLKCDIKHPGLDIKEFRYLIKNADEGKNIQIKVGDVAEDNSEVKSEVNGDDSTTVTLVLYLAEDWHFDSEFILEVVNNNGYVSQVPVKLNEIAGYGTGYGKSKDPNNGSGFLLASMMMTLLCTLLAAAL